MSNFVHFQLLERESPELFDLLEDFDSELSQSVELLRLLHRTNSEHCFTKEVRKKNFFPVFIFFWFAGNRVFAVQTPYESTVRISHMHIHTHAVSRSLSPSCVGIV